jgi:hypothetical protein
MSALSLLVDCTVARVELVHDYLQFTFSDGSTLNIYNKYRYFGDVADIENKTLVSVDETQERVLLHFSGSQLEIGLRNEDYSGPEALALQRPGHALVVWD